MKIVLRLTIPLILPLCFSMSPEAKAGPVPPSRLKLLFFARRRHYSCQSRLQASQTLILNNPPEH